MKETHLTELAGQVTLVTGGGRGNGRAIALRLAQAGAAVAVLARSAGEVAETAAVIEAAGGRAVALVADVTDFAALQAAVQEIETTLGPLALLVNNAASIGAIGPSWQVDADLWWRCQEVNVRGPFLCVQAVLPGMAARRQGRIVNVASLSGLGPMAHASSYAVSKAALVRWSEILALESAPYGIGVFATHPGDIITPLSEVLMEEKNSQWLPGARRHFLENGSPIEDAGELVYWLALGKGDALSGRFFSVYEDAERMAAQAQAIAERDLYVLRLQRL